jgi:hypothetical protein
VSPPADRLRARWKTCRKSADVSSRSDFRKALRAEITPSVRTPSGVHQALNRARPFARRRANTARPVAVAIRALKPCTRLRCKTLG